jgi:hypothetical protein
VGVANDTFFSCLVGSTNPMLMNSFFSNLAFRLFFFIFGFPSEDEVSMNLIALSTGRSDNNNNSS